MAGVVPSGMAPAMLTPWLRSRLEAQRFLARRQSEDGAWRSTSYGSFKSGEGLTPLVLHAAWPGLKSERRKVAVDWLRKQGEKTWQLFPVHNAGWLLALATREGALQRFVPVLEAHLRGLQLSTAQGWTRGHPCHGGWGYAATTVCNEGGLLAPMQEPNLSATVLAVAGLRRAGVQPGDPVLAEAARFMAGCQNFRTGEQGDPEFDDGGFFQMANDPSRNKAGVAGTDREGRKRFRSYFSATADGVRGLLMCGVKRSDPRVTAGLRWMEKNPASNDVPDLTFYAGYARARVRELAKGRPRPTRGDGAGQGTSPLQNHDGSYANPAGEMRENEPLVATSLALLS